MSDKVFVTDVAMGSPQNNTPRSKRKDGPLRLEEDGRI